MATKPDKNSKELEMGDILEDAPRIEYVVNDVDNPHSALNLTASCPTVHAAIKRVMIEAPHLLTLDEGTFKDKYHFSMTISRIRFSFWAEYENAVTRNRPMFLSQIIGGICTEYFFKNDVLKSNEKVGFILCPPSNYVVQMKEALQAGAETVRKMLSAKVVDDEGYLIPKAAEVVLKAFALLDMRVKGAVVQRVDQRTLSFNVNSTAGQNVLPIPNNMDDLEKELEAVKQKIMLAETRVPEKNYGTDNPKTIGVTLLEEEQNLVIDVEKVSGGLTGYKIKS